MFFRDSSNDLQVSWTQLIVDLNETENYNPYCFANDYYDVLKHLITSLILGEEIILIDSDFTSEELTRVTGYSEFTSFDKAIDNSEILGIRAKNELIEKIKTPKQAWSITLFTSGTTGLPKKVSHSFKSITRFVKTSSANAENIWGFANNPSHMAGVQVFFQALLNGNSLVRLFGLSKEQIFNEIESCGITNLSATPTFYRMLLPSKSSFSSVKRITFGGEKFDECIVDQLRSIFPDAKITNVYASTEAGTLFASTGNTFTINPGFEPLTKIESGELLIHHSLVGNTGSTMDEWYHTGDLIEITANNPVSFRFVSRKNEMINVGGYKVNPGEVEEAIRNIPGIKDVRVYGKTNSVLGNVVCCEVVKADSQLEESTIRLGLQTKLQEFKIPRMITFVDKISTTRTGKIKRNGP
ncbi:MAG: long-chain fatty acid--CoA ligase [bacterium]